MGGLPEMAEVVSGLVFRHGDGDHLAARIDELWSDRDAARERGEAGRRAALDYYDRGRHLDALLALYEEV
jgi:glycosyltransferase involved in cell wall biosynthesis